MITLAVSKYQSVQVHKHTTFLWNEREVRENEKDNE
jgi:hypothetical protein